MNKRDYDLRKGAIENFVCPHCGKRGEGFLLREAVIKQYIAITAGFEEWEDEDTLLLDGTMLIQCWECQERLSRDKYYSSGANEFLEEVIVPLYADYKAALDNLEARLATETEQGLVHPDLHKAIEDLKKQGFTYDYRRDGGTGNDD